MIENAQADNRVTTDSMPPTLKAGLLSSGHEAALADDTLHLLEDRINSSPGLKGVALRTGIGVLKATRPNMLQRAVHRLLPDLIAALEPFYSEYRERVGSTGQPGEFSDFLIQHEEAATNAVMQSMDSLVSGSSNAVRSFYARTRSTINREIHGAMPSLSQRIDAELWRTGN